jgi:hypothetical protein
MSFVIAYGSSVQSAFVGCVCFRFTQRVRVKSARLDTRYFFRPHVLGLGLCFAGMNLCVIFGLFSVVFRFAFFLFLVRLGKNCAAD